MRNNSYSIKAGGRTKRDELLRRVFGGLEVVDADANLMVTVESVDGEGAERANAENCVFSRACHRLYHSSKAVFFKTTVYIDLPDEEGERKIYRFRAGKRMQIAIADYDRKESFEPGLYVLRKPSNVERLDVMREASRRMRVRESKVSAKKRKAKAKHREALIKSKARKVKTIKNALDIATLVRSGTGLVQTKVARQ